MSRGRQFGRPPPTFTWWWWGWAGGALIIHHHHHHQMEVKEEDGGEGGRQLCQQSMNDECLSHCVIKSQLVIDPEAMEIQSWRKVVWPCHRFSFCLLSTFSKVLNEDPFVFKCWNEVVSAKSCRRILAKALKCLCYGWSFWEKRKEKYTTVVWEREGGGEGGGGRINIWLPVTPDTDTNCS